MASRRGVCARARPRALSLAGGVARLDDEVGVTRATRGTDSGAATAERNDAARHGVADKRCGSTDRERQRRHHQTMARGTAKTKIEPCSRCFARRGARSRLGFSPKRTRGARWSGNGALVPRARRETLARRARGVESLGCSRRRRLSNVTACPRQIA